MYKNRKKGLNALVSLKMAQSPITPQQGYLTYLSLSLSPSMRQVKVLSLLASRELGVRSIQNYKKAWSSFLIFFIHGRAPLLGFIKP